MSRKSISPTVQAELLEKSMRRCAICFGVNNDSSQKSGQIAHLDQNNANPALENLVWLCLNHHDDYDGSTSQSKNYTFYEVKRYRDMLYDFVQKQRSQPVGINPEVEKITSSLNYFMQFVPFSFLRSYIEDFPYHFDSNIDGPGETWRLYKRDNIMVYPFSDIGLNQRLDRFFAFQDRIEFLINAHYIYRNPYGMEYRCNCFEVNLNGDKMTLNSALTSQHKSELENEIQSLRVNYLSSYNLLAEYIRSNYPKVNLDQYRI
ncbi:hypothetical protein [Vibrio alginolyticus]|uniref:hypothetical protein n=1 Tax=Vibrio alginolyticus TaxID=663 RepID=UPI0010BD011F|nr:hypothetical protein [Vibrio alginolyticus]TKF10991.1 hypothetical protein FCV48_04965 [Vibrio alginolyticus]